MIQELISIIEDLRQVAKQQGMNISDEILFIQALTCYRTPNFNNQKLNNGFLPRLPPFTSDNQNGTDRRNSIGRLESPLPTLPVTESNASGEKVNTSAKITSPVNNQKLATEKQIEYAHQLAKSLNQTLNLTKDITSQEISEVIKSLNQKKWAKKQ